MCIRNCIKYWRNWYIFLAEETGIFIIHGDLQSLRNLFTQCLWIVIKIFLCDHASVGTPLLHGAHDALVEWPTYVDGWRNAISRRQVVGSNRAIDSLRLQPAYRKWKDHAEKRFRSAPTSSRLYEYHDASATYPS